MYKKGMLKVTTEKCNEEYCRCNSLHEVSDEEFIYDTANAVYLPHSCQEWVIGEKKDVEAMIEDLQEILNKLK